MHETGQIAVRAIDARPGIAGFVVTDPEFVILDFPVGAIASRGRKHRLRRFAFEIENGDLSGVCADVTVDDQQGLGYGLQADQLNAGVVVASLSLGQLAEIAVEVVYSETAIALVHHQAALVDTRRMHVPGPLRFRPMVGFERDDEEKPGKQYGENRVFQLTELYSAG